MTLCWGDLLNPSCQLLYTPMALCIFPLFTVVLAVGSLLFSPVHSYWKSPRSSQQRHMRGHLQPIIGSSLCFLPHQAFCCCPVPRGAHIPSRSDPTILQASFSYTVLQNIPKQWSFGKKLEIQRQPSLLTPQLRGRAWEGLTAVVGFWCRLLSGWGRSLLSRIFGVLNIEKLSDLVKCLFHIKMTMQFLFQTINLFSCAFSDTEPSLHSWDTRHLRFLSSYCFSVLLDSVCWFLFTYYNCVCMLWHIYGSQKTSSAGLVLSLHLYTGPRDQTQVIKPAFWIYLFFSFSLHSRC